MCYITQSRLNFIRNFSNDMTKTKTPLLSSVETSLVVWVHQLTRLDERETRWPETSLVVFRKTGNRSLESSMNDTNQTIDSWPSWRFWCIGALSYLICWPACAPLLYLLVFIPLYRYNYRYYLSKFPCQSSPKFNTQGLGWFVKFNSVRTR